MPRISEHSEPFQSYFPSYSWVCLPMPGHCGTFPINPSLAKAILKFFLTPKAIHRYACKCPAMAKHLRTFRAIPKHFQNYSSGCLPIPGHCETCPNMTGKGKVTSSIAKIRKSGASRFLAKRGSPFLVPRASEFLPKLPHVVPWVPKETQRI